MLTGSFNTKGTDVWACTYTHANTHAHTHTRTRARIHTHARTDAHTLTHAHTHISRHSFACACACTHTHTYTHTHTHTQSSDTAHMHSYCTDATLSLSLSHTHTHTHTHTHKAQTLMNAQIERVDCSDFTRMKHYCENRGTREPSVGCKCLFLAHRPSTQAWALSHSTQAPQCDPKGANRSFVNYSCKCWMERS